MRDTGIGIAPDKRATIFNAFTQADNSTVRQYGGTGLGLSITRLLLELMGSRIEVESEVGQGARFFFTLPVKRATAPGANPRDRDTPAADLSDRRVLLVEDVAVNRMIFRQFLQQWGLVHFDEAADGEEAVAMAQQTTYDLILMDVRMPVMDGYMATRAIRALPDDTYRQVPIIALTADTLDEISKHSESPLFTDVITKPFVPEDAHWTILRHLSPPSVSVAEDDPPVAVSLKSVQKMFAEDWLAIRLFMEKAVRELRSMRRRFTQAMVERNEVALVNLVHKAAMLLDLLALYDLRDYLRLCLVLVMDQAPADQMAEAEQQGVTMIDQAIASAEAELSRMDSDDQ